MPIEQEKGGPKLSVVLLKCIKIQHIDFYCNLVDYFCFDLGLSFHSGIFHSYGDITNTGDGLQFFSLYSPLVSHLP